MKTTKFLSATMALCTSSFTVLAPDTNILTWNWYGIGYGATNVPQLATNVIALAGSDLHCVGLLADRTVVAWGDNTYGQTNVPANATNVEGIAAGNFNSLAATADGSVLLWGRMTDGGAPQVPASATNVVALGVGRGALHSLALRADGTVVDWGWAATTPPADAFNIVGVAAGSYHSLAVRSDGRVVSWGMHNNPVPASATNIVAVAAGDDSSIGLRADGTLLCWGGIGTQPTAATNVVDLAACGSAGLGNSAIVLKRDGTIVFWGYPKTMNATNIMAVGGLTWGALAVKAAGPPIFPLPAACRVVAAGQRAYLRSRAVGALPMSFQWSFQGTNLPGATKEVWVVTNALPGSAGNYTLVASNAMGAITNSDMQLLVVPLIITNQPASLSTNAGATTTLTVGALSTVLPIYQWAFNGTNIDWGTNSSLTLTNLQLTNSGVYSVGVSNDYGGVISSNAVVSIWPIIITSQPQPATQAVCVGASPTLSVTVQAQSPTYQWSINGTNISRGTNSSITLTNIQLSDAGAYSVTITNAFGSTNSSSASISVWPILITQSPQDAVIFRGGTANFTILAQASSPLSYQWQFLGTNLPTATTNTLTLTNVLWEQAGLYAVITSTTNAMATNSAILSVVQVATWGDNTYGQCNVPPTLTNVIGLALGGMASHCLALNRDGLVTGWGRNNSGQTAAPADLTNVVAIAAGRYFSLGLRADGTIVGWGSNTNGQTTPPMGLTNAVAVASASEHGAALVADGTVVAWGDNSRGQTNVPAGLTNVTMIAACYYHNVALKADGTVVAWGDNTYHQTNVPVGLTNAVAVAAGWQHNLALLADETVVGWGNNGSGQTNVPSGLTNVVAIAAGGSHSLALRADGSTVAWGSRTYGKTNIPSGLTNVVAIAAGATHCYALVGNAPPVLNGLPVDSAWSNHAFSVALVSQNNRVYRLEHKDNLSDGAWVAHPLVAGTGGVLTFTDSTATGTQRFYRVRRW